jgi:hypothetical protein
MILPLEPTRSMNPLIPLSPSHSVETKASRAAASIALAILAM